MCRLIGNFGVQDPYGEGDYWVADEPFSTKDLVVTQFKSRVVVPELRRRLDDFLAGNPAVGSALAGCCIVDVGPSVLSRRCSFPSANGL